MTQQEIPTQTSRPDKSLLTQYLVSSLMAFVFFPIVIVPLLIKYFTLEYRFDQEGISMRWGFFFRREINLTYARIQDIQVTRNFIERWLGIATLAIQTASGSASAEMTLQGIRNFEPLRDYLYARMRGTRQETPSGAGKNANPFNAQAVEILETIRKDLAAVRQALKKEGDDVHLD